MSNDKVDPTMDGKLNESIEELKGAYEIFVSHLGLTVQLKQLLAADKLTVFPHLTDLLVPQAIRASEEEFELNKQRHKRLKASLDNCLNLINAKVLSLQEEIVEELAIMQGYYELVHMIFFISSMFLKAQQLYVLNDERLTELLDIEQKLAQISIPQDLRLAYALSNSSNSLRHKTVFEELFWNFKDNLIYLADSQADCRIKIGSYNYDIQNLKLIDIASKYQLRMTPAFLEVIDLMSLSLVKTFSESLNPIPDKAEDLTIKLIQIFTELQSWEKKAESCHQKLSDLDLRSKEEKDESSKDDVLKAHLATCQETISELTKHHAEVKDDTLKDDYLLATTFSEKVLILEHLSKKARDYLSRIYKIIDNGSSSHDQKADLLKLQSISAKLQGESNKTGHFLSDFKPQ